MSQSDFVTRGQALVAAGQYQEAVKVCRLGLLGRPTTVEGRVVLGHALLALKRFDEVLAEMRVALELDHASIAAQLLKAEALLRKGDSNGAIDLLQRVRALAPGEGRAAQLLAEAESSAAHPPLAVSHPSVGFVGGPAAESMTKHYPNHGADEEDTGDDNEGTNDAAGSYTRPTSLQAPGAKKRSQPQQAMTVDATPSPAVLAVGDRSGTVEVDPELDGVELGQDDFGEVIAPPPDKPRRGKAKPAEPALFGTSNGPRGQVVQSQRKGKLPDPQAAKRAQARARKEVSSVELMDDELIEVDEPNLPPAGPEPRRRVPGPGTAVRNAVAMPAGPIDLPPMAAPRPTAQAHASVPPHLAPLAASQPAMINAAMPTMVPQQMLPMPMPQPPLHMPPAPLHMPPPMMQTQLAPPPMQPMPVPGLPAVPPGAMPAAARPTVALNAEQQQSAAVVDALFGNGLEPAQPAWARSTVVAGGPAHRLGADDPTRQPMPVDPQIAALSHPSFLETPSGASMVDQSGSKPMKTGVRKGRSRLQIALWIIVGAVMIGGGVFAGFQIRAMRLKKQIEAAREQAVELAKADTWSGWLGARERLARIAEASDTVDNRAALAHARALVAFEFGDGLVEAKDAVGAIESVGTLDAELAKAYLALAQSDGKAAKAAAEKALELAPADAGALYVSGQAAILDGDVRTSVANTKAAYEKEARPRYSVGLARAHMAATQWDEALAAAGDALKAVADHPAALIQKALAMAETGRVVPGGAPGNELRAQLDKIVVEGRKPLAEQPRGVSPMQAATAALVLARVDFARGDAAAAHADTRNAITMSVNLGVSDQRFAEEACETLYASNLLAAAKKGVEDTLALWPTSRRARTVLALTALAENQPAVALETMAKLPELDRYPRGLAIRGQAKLANGDVDGAKADLDAALKKAPRLEPALIGRAWIDLAADDVEEARKRIQPRIAEAGSSVALTTVYAAVLRAGADAEGRKKALVLLERAVAGAPSVAVGRALLELARLQRDLGDSRAARTAYAGAAMAGNSEARIEAAALAIEERDPLGGRDSLDALLKEAGANATPQLQLEAARARMIAGDHKGAEELLNAVDKQPRIERWRYDRERGRLALRRGDYAGAADSLGRALDGCGDDAETFLLAADVVSADIKLAKLVEKLRQLAPKRLANQPEAQVVVGKLALAEDNNEAAEKAYQAARTALSKNATPRRQAQADFGYAVVLLNKKEDALAQNTLALVIERDPSLFSAQLYLAEVVKDTNAKKAYELAEKAVSYNPDFVDGWVVYGTLAARLRKRAELTRAITRVGELAPASEALGQLQSLRF